MLPPYCARAPEARATSIPYDAHHCKADLFMRRIDTTLGIHILADAKKRATPHQSTRIAVTSCHIAKYGILPDSQGAIVPPSGGASMSHGGICRTHSAVGRERLPTRQRPT